MNKPVNFEKMISESGQLKRDIAKIKGVKPETLSRHISGQIKMTLDDAFEYAEILGCAPQDIFFPATGMPVVGTVKMEYNDKEPAFKTAFTRELWSGKPRFAWTATYAKAVDFGVFVHEGNETYNGPLNFITQSVDVVDKRPIEGNYIHQQVHEAWAYCKVSDDFEKGGCEREMTNIVLAVVYPQPDNLFTLHNPGGHNNQVRDVKLDWATPILATAMHPLNIFQSLDG